MFVGEDQADFNLGDKDQRELIVFVPFEITLLTAVTLDLANNHFFQWQVRQRLDDLFREEWFDDRDDLLHGISRHGDFSLRFSVCSGSRFSKSIGQAGLRHDQVQCRSEVAWTESAGAPTAITNWRISSRVNAAWSESANICWEWPFSLPV